MSSADVRLELAVYSARGVTTHLVTPEMTLTRGRGDEADIAVDDVAVSRRQAIFHGGPPLEVGDLESSNGTFVSRALQPPPSSHAGELGGPAARKHAAHQGRRALHLGDQPRSRARRAVADAIAARLPGLKLPADSAGRRSRDSVRPRSST